MTTRKRLEGPVHGSKALTRDEFATLVETGKIHQGAESSEILLRKHYTSEVKAVGEPASRQIEFIITTQSKDRMGDEIMTNGWETENFLKNPVVLFAHDSRNPPVGRALAISKTKNGLKSVAEFMDNDVDTSGFSDMIYRMIKGKFLNATSVGFAPMDWEWIKEADEETGDTYITGMRFLKQELLEWSVVPVPANAEALVVARDAGINIRPLEKWYEEALDTWSKTKGNILIPRKDAEMWYKTVKQVLRVSATGVIGEGEELPAGESLLTTPPNKNPVKGVDTTANSDLNSTQLGEGESTNTTAGTQVTTSTTPATPAKQTPPEVVAGAAAGTEGAPIPAPAPAAPVPPVRPEDEAGVKNYKFQLDLAFGESAMTVECSGPDAEIIQKWAESFFTKAAALHQKKEAGGESVTPPAPTPEVTPPPVVEPPVVETPAAPAAEAPAPAPVQASGDDEQINLDDIKDILPGIIREVVREEVDRLRGKVN